MAVIGIDDTDSMKTGMCTTYVGHEIAQKIKSEGFHIEQVLLIRLNPAAKHKTRGNAAVCIHTDMSVNEAHKIASDYVVNNSQIEDEKTNPAVVTGEKEDCEKLSNFTERAIRELIEIEEAQSIIRDLSLKKTGLGNERGVIGCLAAIGSDAYVSDWTFENICYREEHKWGTEREFDAESVFKAADGSYPDAWDTVDRKQGDVVCVPRTPCPILYGIRGDDRDVVKKVSNNIDSEKVASSQLFKTNQGTDLHLQESTIEKSSEDGSYKIESVIKTEPETKKGGHVEFSIKDQSGELEVIAFEPTKHFRSKVRNLRCGDKIIACGEISENTLKLEKFALIKRNMTRKVNPECPSCGNNMSSAGKNQGYRCRGCSERKDQKDEVEIDRNINVGWHEVPPCARRHIAKPLVRFDNSMYETHPYI